MNLILIGRNDSASISLDPRYSNRHGMIASANASQIDPQIARGVRGGSFGGRR
jgi:hypothetical protein